MHRPVFLQHLERYETRAEARKRELKIQSWNHEQKIEFIKNISKGDILSAI
jgi:predicted GIY-YIG superfamily endonuclease